jgi:hypothetical protein
MLSTTELTFRDGFKRGRTRGTGIMNGEVQRSLLRKTHASRDKTSANPVKRCSQGLQSLGVEIEVVAERIWPEVGKTPLNTDGFGGIHDRHLKGAIGSQPESHYADA